MQVAKQLSTGQNWLPDWMREFSAKVNHYQSERLCLGGRVNHSATGIWRFINQAATKIHGRDLQGLVSSLVLAVAGADEQDYYLCPRSILRKGGNGRSWAINNTSNLPEVE
jgi:hypothetical protein